MVCSFWAVGYSGGYVEVGCSTTAFSISALRAVTAAMSDTRWLPSSTDLAVRTAQRGRQVSTRGDLVLVLVHLVVGDCSRGVGRGRQ